MAHTTQISPFQKLPYRPIILRDLLSDCDIRIGEAAEAVGACYTNMKLCLNRGRVPAKDSAFQRRVEDFIVRQPEASRWLKTKHVELSGIWQPSMHKMRLMPTGWQGRLREIKLGKPCPRRKIVGAGLPCPSEGAPLHCLTNKQKERWRRIMESRLEVLDAFGYRTDPFQGCYLDTADSMRLKRLVKMAVQSNAMVSVVATWGAGKTTALERAWNDLDAKIVNFLPPDKERTRIVDIEKTFIRALSQEDPKQQKEIRIHQLRRVLGEASREHNVVLVLEEAHRMHGQTLRSLKTLRELEWMGRRPLFSVVLIGQYNPLRKPGVDEVRLRSDTVTMKGLTSSEVKDYIKNTVGKDFEHDATEAISRLSDARNFLDLQEMLVELMGKALEYARDKVTALEVFEVYGGGLKEVVKRTGTSLSELEKETGISKSAISQAINDVQGTTSDSTWAQSRAAIADVLRPKLDDPSAGSGHGEKPLKLVNKD